MFVKAYFSHSLFFKLFIGSVQLLSNWKEICLWWEEAVEPIGVEGSVEGGGGGGACHLWRPSACVCLLCVRHMQPGIPFSVSSSLCGTYFVRLQQQIRT